MRDLWFRRAAWELQLYRPVRGLRPDNFASSVAARFVSLPAMLSEKPWRPDALVRLFVAVMICVFAGSVVAGALAFSPTSSTIHPALFYAIIVAALAMTALALVLVLRPGPVEAMAGRFLWVMLCLFLSLTLAGWAQHLGGTLPRATHSFRGVVVGTLSFQGAALLLVGWFLREHRIGWREAFGFRIAGAGRAVLLGLLLAGLAVAFQLGYVALLSHLQFNPEEQHIVQVLRLRNTLGERIYLGAVTIVLVPLAEEMLFRGILYPTIKQLGFRRTALWSTALLFAAIHLNLASFLPLTLLAVALALLYEKTDNLLAPITAHAGFNAMNFVMLYLMPETSP